MSSMTGNRGPAGLSAGMNQAGGNVIPKGYRQGQMQQFTPEQMKLFEQMFGHVGPQSYLSKLASGDEGFFQQIEAPAWKNFEQAQGQLASRFSGMGLGGRHGSGFNLAATQMGSDFAQNLAAQRQKLQQQAIMDLLGLSESLLSKRPYEQFLVEKPKSFWESLISSGASGLGSGLGMLGGAFGMKKFGL